MDLTVCRLPTSAGRKPLYHGLYFESENMRQNKQCIVQINNAKDVMCMARAVVVEKCHADKDNSETWKKTWKSISDSRNSLQTREAKKLLDQVNIPHDRVCGTKEYKKIQDVLTPDYLIEVHSQHPKDGLVFTPQFKKEERTKVIHIYWNGNNHYDCVTSVTALLGCRYYCKYCDVGYSNRGNHPCPNGCEACQSDILCITEQKIKCVDCHRIFRSQSCFDNHKFIKTYQKKSICQLVYSCEKCSNRIIGKKENHVCPGERKCKFCKEIVGPNHQCYIQKYKQDKKRSKSEEFEDEESQEEEPETTAPKFVFYDFEST